MHVMDRSSRSRFPFRSAASFLLACVSVGITSLSFRKRTTVDDGFVNVYNVWTGVGVQRMQPLVLDSESSTNRTNWETVRSEQLHAGLERVESGAWIPPHSHTTEELVLVYDGRGYVYTENGRKAPIETGSMLHILSGVRHAFHNAGDQPMWLMWCFPVLKKDDAFRFRQNY
ncbi:Cupin [Gracilaria domingensis]|nr:Cupin [Gracilaria domingensis]